MTSALPGSAEVLVLGAGLSGLAAATRLAARGVDVHLVDAGDAAGGPIRTVAIDGYRFEGGPNSIRGGGAAMTALIAAAGLLDQRTIASPLAKDRWIYHGGVHRVNGPKDLFGGNLLTPGGRARLLSEPFRRAWKGPRDATISAFIADRLGPEVVERLLEPAITGIFAGDPGDLELPALKMVAILAEHGGIIRGMKYLPRDKAQILSFAGGLQSLPRALGDHLGARLHLGVTVSALARDADAWQVDTSHGTVRAKTIVCAIPAPATARLLAAGSLGSSNGAALDALASLPMASVATVGLGLRDSDLARPASGFGLLIAPRTPLGRVQGLVFASSIFPDRAPPGRSAVTAIIGGVRAPDAVGLDDAALIAEATSALQRTHGLSNDPEVAVVHRWPRAIAQYRPGHAAAVRALRAALPRTFILAGSGFDGVGLADAVTSGYAAADAASV